MSTDATSFLVDLDKIEVVDRLRPLDQNWVDFLAASFKAQGQLQAIEVTKLPASENYRLVFGAHRVAAARQAGFTQIEAKLGAGDKAERRLREIMENVARRELNPIDRAAFIAEMYALVKAQAGLQAGDDGRKHSANVRWQKELKAASADATAKIAGAYGLQAAVAEKLGMSERTLRDDLLLFKRLSPSIVERIRPLAIAGNAAALRKLAALEPVDQGKAVNLIEAGKAKDVSAAIAQIQKRPPVDAAKKRLQAFTDAYSRMSKREQRDALRVLSRMLPAGVIEIVFDDEVKVAAE